MTATTYRVWGKGSILAAGVLAISAGCTLQLFENAECSSNADCTSFGAGFSCNTEGFCSEGEIDNPFAELQVGMLYIGPVGDHGWTKTHDDGRKVVLDTMENVEVDFVPSVMPADAPLRIDEFIANGANVVIGTSFDFLSSIQAAALANPDVNFLLTSGSTGGENFSGYFGRMYQVMYQAGALAGLMTTGDKVGIVGPVIIPETVRHVNAFTRGVRSTNPSATVTIEWAEAWFDPVREEAAANALLNANVDVLFGHTDTTIPLETANARWLAIKDNDPAPDPIYTIGYDNPDACTFIPSFESTCIASAYWNWGPILTRLLGQMQRGEWDSSAVPWDQMGSDPDTSTAFLSETSRSLVPSNVRLQVEALVEPLSQDSLEGRMLPFKGPVRDNTLVARFAAGTYPTDAELLRMCWFVEGVIDVTGAPAVVPQACVGDR